MYTVLAHGDSVVSAQAVTNRTAVLTGGGLTAPKTVSVGGLPTDWSTASAEDQSTAAQIAAHDRERAERQLWRVWVPLVLAAFAVWRARLAVAPEPNRKGKSFMVNPTARARCRCHEIASTTTVLVAAAGLVLTACGHPNATSSASKPGSGNAVKVTMANDGGKDGCALNTTSVPAGPVTFTVTNTNAPGITEVELLRDQRIIGEKENLAPGLDPVSFTVTLDGGSYQLYCPGAATEYQSLTVTGRAPAPPSGTVASILGQGTKDYAAYVVGQIGQLNDAVKALDAAVQSGNLDAAKTAYAKARPF